jgi:hypothetical protein
LSWFLEAQREHPKPGNEIKFRLKGYGLALKIVR